ncbi:CRISPR-associated endonuclease Cas1/CRISPR-associated protein Cas4,TIGR00372 [Nannocystis exedens]|uniref:CRISPR-associated endonuclease Cas1 n=1 Tax=Nannocystis exedens TaxID=54 RepID=A0A1I2J3I2_9BACT|nr:CRISPR-associated endonuclease Cas1 [Nannocystis exedens]PCC74658.1 CRISPR-associated endonuclease Cas4/Cas1 [Nannocystis exedens]SFF48588.1 CRISPR-associated endonuclease Cas1/CRISPR-associated protein Cas4,TIGR00372 [Nannocystis exedens]
MIEPDQETIPVRMCNELVYCPRLFHLEHVQGIFVESADTIEGSGQHERAARRGKVKRRAVDPAASTPEPETLEALPWDAQIPRSMEFASPAWGVHGRLDLVELAGDEVVAVEAKRGAAPRSDRHRWNDHELPYRAWPPDVAQLGLYMALLRDAGLPCSEGRLFYRKDGTHTIITWSDDLERFLREVVHEARRLRLQTLPPEPLVDSPKCLGCSLHGVCLPDEHHALQAEELALRDREVRRILPGRDDRAVVHITRPGTLVRKDGDALVVCPRDEEPTRLLLKDIAHVAVYGPSQITEQCLQHLLVSGVPVSHHTGAGRLLGLTAPLLTQNIALRRAQYRCADDPARALAAARGLVVAKIRNQRTVLRRYARGIEQALDDELGDLPEWAAVDDDPAPSHEELAADRAGGESPAHDATANRPADDPRKRCGQALRDMRQALRRAEHAGEVNALRGHEGEAAAHYFAALPAILPAAWQRDFCGRSRRPPRDRVNALLSFGYALLIRDATAAAARVGLDPMLGFLHVAHPGRPALALDLVEPFRAAWVDTAVLRLIATRGIDRDDFVFSSAGVALTDRGRRALIAAYERRADELTTHPRFGYRMSYRRLLELEARVLGKWLVGEIDQFTPLWTR